MWKNEKKKPYIHSHEESSPTGKAWNSKSNKERETRSEEKICFIRNMYYKYATSVHPHLLYKQLILICGARKCKQRG